MIHRKELGEQIHQVETWMISNYLKFYKNKMQEKIILNCHLFIKLEVKKKIIKLEREDRMKTQYRFLKKIPFYWVSKWNWKNWWKIKMLNKKM